MTYAWLSLTSLDDTRIVRYDHNAVTNAILLPSRTVYHRVYGTSIDVVLPEGTEAPTSWIVAYDTGSIYMIYHVKSLKPTNGGYAVHAELAALQTFYANTSYFNDGYLRLHRYSAKDTTDSNGVSQNTSGEPIDGSYTTICDRQYQKRWTQLSDYCVVVTYVNEPDNTDGSSSYDRPPAAACRRLASNRSYVLTDGSYNILRAYDSNPGNTSGMLQLTNLCQNIGAQKDKIYRVQLVPYELVNVMANAGGLSSDSRFALKFASGGVVYHRFVYSADITAWQTVSYTWPTVTNQKALGNPMWILRYNADELVRLPVRSIQSLTPISGYNYSLNLGGTACNGVSMYIDVRGSSRTLALVSIPLPEISAVVDSSTVYWQTAGQQAVDRAALGLLTGGIAVAGSTVAAVSTGGALTPLLIGSAVSTASTAVNYATEVARGQRQAENSVYSAGLGAGVVNASNLTLPQLEIWLERYPTTAITERENYFRRNGYTGAYHGSTSMITTFPRSRYISFAGSGEIPISITALPHCLFSRAEFNEKLNNELSRGVTVWAANQSPGYGQGNPTN